MTRTVISTPYFQISVYLRLLNAHINTCNVPLTPSSAVYDVLKTPSKRHIYTRSVVDDMLVNIQSTRGNQVTKLHPKHKHTQHASSSVSWRRLTTKLYTSDTRRPPCRFSVCEGRSTHTHTHVVTSGSCRRAGTARV